MYCLPVSLIISTTDYQHTATQESLSISLPAGNRAIYVLYGVLSLVRMLLGTTKAGRDFMSLSLRCHGDGGSRFVLTRSLLTGCLQPRCESCGRPQRFGLEER